MKILKTFLILIVLAILGILGGLSGWAVYDISKDIYLEAPLN